MVKMMPASSVVVCAKAGVAMRRARRATTNEVILGAIIVSTVFRGGEIESRREEICAHKSTRLGNVCSLRTRTGDTADLKLLKACGRTSSFSIMGGSRVETSVQKHSRH